MSAWIVSKRHIDFLVKCIVRSEAVPEAGVDLDEIGRVLWRENHRSVNYRYSERSRTPRYEFADIELPVDDVAYLLKQVACYQYQACERRDWKRSTAFEWTQRLADMLEAGLLREFGEAWRKAGPYAAAPWGIEDDYAALVAAR
jgi:hypothetical protein